MRPFALLLFLVVGLAAARAQDWKADTQAGNFLYHMPTGWNPVEKDGTTLLFAPGPPSGTRTFIALTANDLDGDLQKSFNELWGGFKNSYRILEGGQISPLHSKYGYEAFYTAAVAADQSGARWTVYVMGAQYRKRLQTVMFMSNVPAGSYLTATLNIFKLFLESLRFGEALPGATVPPVDAAPVEEKAEKLPAGALDGIYVGYAIGGGGGAGMKRLHFNPDGWVVKDVPQEGMIGFDFTKYRNAADTNRSWVGRYRLDGDQIIILWQDYPDDRQVIKRNEVADSPGIDVYIPMCRCTGTRFSGKYNWGLTGSGQYIQFFTDGTFLDHAVLDQMLVPNPYYEHPRTQRGTYTIQSQTMIFTFADGRKGMRTFYAPKAQESRHLFEWIGLGWQTLYEEHYQNQP